MMIRVEPFGKAGGEACQLYTLTNRSGASVGITNYSGAIVFANVPDKKGRLDNVILGFRDVKQYAKNPGYLGALIGPVGNRISGAAFEFGGKKYAFSPNEGESTLLHSGSFGFHAGAWDAVAEADEKEARLILKRDFPNGKTGFPGNLNVTVTYTFNENNELGIRYEAESDEESFMSPTNHSYFNLGGLGLKHVPGVERQTIEIFADHYTTVDKNSIPTGTAPVEGTPFDLRSPVKLADGFAREADNEQMVFGAGYDHNFVLSGETDENGLRLAARVTDDRTGRVMKVYTDMPCVQLYTANHLERYNAAERRYYKKRDALCLETQCAPDSIHREGEFGFEVKRVAPGAPFSSTTVYAFGTK